MPCTLGKGISHPTGVESGPVALHAHEVNSGATFTGSFIEKVSTAFLLEKIAEPMQASPSTTSSRHSVSNYRL